MCKANGVSSFCTHPDATGSLACLGANNWLSTIGYQTWMLTHCESCDMPGLHWYPLVPTWYPPAMNQIMLNIAMSRMRIALKIVNLLQHLLMRTSSPGKKHIKLKVEIYDGSEVMLFIHINSFTKTDKNNALFHHTSALPMGSQLTLTCTLPSVAFQVDQKNALPHRCLETTRDGFHDVTARVTHHMTSLVMWHHG